MLQLEAYGYCQEGEGGDYVSSGIIELGGARPNNTSGGHLCEGYTHGIALVTENVRQLRHQADDYLPQLGERRTHLRLQRGRLPPGEGRGDHAQPGLGESTDRVLADHAPAVGGARPMAAEYLGS